MTPNAQREKVLRKERGEMLLRLFREHPLLTVSGLIHFCFLFVYL